MVPAINLTDAQQHCSYVVSHWRMVLFSINQSINPV